MESKEKRTWAEIDLVALEHNYRALRAMLPAECKFLGVVKANAYGHGALPVARRLEQLGADYLAVASLDEAAELRVAGVTTPILILGHTPVEFASNLVQLRLTQSVWDPGDCSGPLCGGPGGRPGTQDPSEGGYRDVPAGLSLR